MDDNDNDILDALRYCMANIGIDSHLPNANSLVTSLSASMKIDIEVIRKMFYDSIADSPSFRTPIIPEYKCECGKEKHGFANHSQWCDIKE